MEKSAQNDPKMNKNCGNFEKNLDSVRAKVNK